MIKVRTCKDKIFKPIPPLSGLTSLVTTTSCTIVGVVGVLLLFLISTNTKLWGLYLKLGKVGGYACNSNW